MRLSSAAIYRKRVNLYRPAVVKVSHSFGGPVLDEFTLQFGADPIRVLPGKLGKEPEPDVIEFVTTMRRAAR